jgi:predicted transcriptional regulator
VSQWNTLHGNRRNLLEVFAEVLDCCIVPQVKTQLISKEDLSLEIITDYIGHLKFIGLMEESQSSKKYVTTKKGIEYLRRWALLQEIIDPT